MQIDLQCGLAVVLYSRKETTPLYVIVFTNASYIFHNNTL